MIEGAESNGVKFVTLTINKSSTIALPAVRNFYFVLQPSILTPVDCYEHTVNPTTQVETVRNRHDLSTLVTDVITVGNANTPENGQVLSNYAMYMLKDIYFEFICVNSQNSISGSVETFNIHSIKSAAKTNTEHTNGITNKPNVSFTRWVFTSLTGILRQNMILPSERSLRSVLGKY